MSTRYARLLPAMNEELEPLMSGQYVAKFLSISYPMLMSEVAKGTGPPAYRLNDPAHPEHKKLSVGNVKRNKDGSPRRARHVVRFRMSEVEQWLKDRKMKS